MAHKSVFRVSTSPQGQKPRPLTSALKTSGLLIGTVAPLPKYSNLNTAEPSKLNQTTFQPKNKKPCYRLDSRVSMRHKAYLAPRPGLEPGTYGLTVRRSTN